jgi:L-histidine Nalpha-methyltransferase
MQSLVGPGEWLLTSANLAPGEDYETGVQAVLPQYDNTLTRDWLMTALLDLGIEESDGGLRFDVVRNASGLLRIEARFELQQPRAVRVFGEQVAFGTDESIQVFFSYRHTRQTVSRLAACFGFEIRGTWTNEAGDEGVFLLRRC